MIIRKFWQWYERRYTINVGLAAGLFLLQIFHLLWLFTEVIWAKLFGTHLLYLHGMPKTLMLLVDYTEIPVILSVSAVYVNDLRKKLSWKSLLYLVFINLQWLHLFWITDEFVINSLFGRVFTPLSLAWVAILIDYLELPIIFDTTKRFFISLGKRDLSFALAKLKK